jgi:heat shock protein HslJ
MNRMLISTLAVFLMLTGAAAPATADEVVLISSHTRDFIGADANANGTLKGVPLEGLALVVDRITLDGNKMAFRARDGKFVRAGVGQKTLLAAVSDHIRGWETFEIVRVTNAKFAIKSVQNGKYVSLGADGRLSATARNITSRETFSARAAATPQPQPPVVDEEDEGVELAGNWRIHRVRTVDTTLIALPAGIRADSFVNIRQNERFTASTGCNDISGRVRAEDDLVRFSGVATTRMFCVGDNGAFELLLLVAFDHSSRVERVGNDLRFYDVNDDAVMVLRRN